MKTQLDLRMGASKGYDSYVKGLFAAGEKGAWYDPSDFSSLSQTIDGLTPVTAANQYVGKMLDKSGNGKHFIAAANTTVRPQIKQDAEGKFYLEADGADDTMSCSAFDLSSTDAITVAAGLYKTSDAAFGIFVEHGPAVGSNNGTFNLAAPVSAASSIALTTKGTAAAVFATKTDANASAGVKHAVIASSKISTPVATITVDALSTVTSATTQGTGNYTSQTLYLFKRAGASNPFSGRMYSLVIRGATSTAAEVANIKKYLNSKMGL